MTKKLVVNIDDMIMHYAETLLDVVRDGLSSELMDYMDYLHILYETACDPTSTANLRQAFNEGNTMILVPGFTEDITELVIIDRGDNIITKLQRHEFNF